MLISFSFIRCCTLALTLTLTTRGQNSSSISETPSKVILDHILGTLTSVDRTTQTVTVKEDKTGTLHVVELANTKTLLKVEPTAKDLKGAVRISADDLETGDRVDVRGTKSENSPTTLSARAVILMSARDLEATHQQQSAAWARSTAGRVTAINPGIGKITADVRAAGEIKSITVETSSATEFTRYSPDSGKAAPSQLSQIQVGDQLKIIGDQSKDEAVIHAERVYSGAFRTISATISAIGSDGKSLTVKDLATKKEINVSVGSDASIHKLPAMIAASLARRINPSAAATTAARGSGRSPDGEAGILRTDAGGPVTAESKPGGHNSSGNEVRAAGPDGPGKGSIRPGPGTRGDISQLIEHTPLVLLTDLKAGDALVISGVVSGTDNSRLLANAIIAGVEPILQSAPQRSGGRGLGGDWGLGEMSAPQ